MAGYEFGFLMEQSLGHVTHAKNLVANVALTRRCTPIGDWSTLKPWELPEGSLCTGATGRCGQERACREVARMRHSRITEHRKLATDAFSRHTIRGKCCMDTRPRRGPGTLLAPSPSETTLATARIVF
jgi:hypothetical protein